MHAGDRVRRPKDPRAVAVVARPLAHPSAGRCRAVIAAALLALALAAGAEALDVGVAPYREAAQTGQVGVVSGRVYGESATPSGPPRRLPGVVTVTLLPRSQALLTSWERFKDDARGSSKAF